MKIVLLSGLDEPTPPTKYGSVEMLVYCAAKELVELGHDVVVFATEDSADALDFCEFRPYQLTRRGIRSTDLTQAEADKFKLEITRLALQEALTLEADIIHNNLHTGFIAFAERMRKPEHMVTTCHWPFDCPIVGSAIRQARGHSVLTISHAQQRRARMLGFNLSYTGTVYNCIAHERFDIAPTVKTEHLSWVGRFDPLKGVEEAVSIARTLDRPLIMAGKVDNYAFGYFKSVAEPLMQANRGLVEFRGEVSQLEASEIMASSSAFLMTTKYHESFGLVVIEAFAAGTPVVATSMGAMPELVQDGVNGYVVPMLGEHIDIKGFAEAVQACSTIQSEDCREFAKRFHPKRMAHGYALAYETIVSDRFARRAHSA